MNRYYRSFWLTGMFYLLSLSSLMAQRANLARSISRIPLNTITHKVFSIDEIRDSLKVIVFLSPECPLSQQYTLVLDELFHKYAGKAAIIGVFPGSSDPDSVYTAFRRKYHVRFPLLVDPKKKLAHAAGASVTPEAFLLDRRNAIVYFGAIDDRAIAPGQIRSAATLHYLDDAISEVLSGVPVKNPFARAVGCYIE